ncbi:epithelial cell adhesion molecule isoform X2 [Hemicordylus capensis]|uniref:epithelial cell adhesion molecule isoform X2 n=1 Tax=Hemicordylus capensis TaxID=884348 RepID=UPI00230340FC|nr:epithelial cell adhesion molecule isoform X2 [Hemicordylus capensis]
MLVSGCTCEKNKRTQNCVVDGDDCRCVSIGSNMTVSCKTLTSKCLLMKAEVSAFKAGRREKPKHAFVDNDGIYNPECDSQGNFNAKQCNGTSTCWCVNSAGVRRTEKSDKNISCSEVVRTSFIFIEMKHLERNTAPENLEKTIIDVLSQRYNLNRKHINVTYEKPYITIELKQNTSDKLVSDADIADVAYYFEKDVKGDSLIANDKFEILVAGEPLQLENTVIYYVDEKPPEFSMKRLTAGVIAVIVIVVLAIVAGILVLIFTRRKRGKYEKAEVKELNEIPRELKS